MESDIVVNAHKINQGDRAGSWEEIQGLFLYPGAGAEADSGKYRHFDEGKAPQISFHRPSFHSGNVPSEEGTFGGGKSKPLFAGTLESSRKEQAGI